MINENATIDPTLTWNWNLDRRQQMATIDLRRTPLKCCVCW